MSGTAARNHEAGPILVTGGTGTLGRLVVPRLQASGRTVRVLSRHSREADEGVDVVTGDLATGQGIQAAVDGAEIIVHCAGSSKGDEEKARNLVQAASQAGAARWCTSRSSAPTGSRSSAASTARCSATSRPSWRLSPWSRRSGLPWTTLRATQFHDLTLTTVRQMARLPVVPAPAGLRFQPIDTGEVAARLVELALGAPARLVPDVAGPRIYEMTELLRGYLRASGKHRPIVPVRLPGKATRAFRAGANLSPQRAVGRRTWEDFLAERVGNPDQAPDATSPVSSPPAAK